MLLHVVETILAVIYAGDEMIIRSAPPKMLAECPGEVLGLVVLVPIRISREFNGHFTVAPFFTGADMQVYAGVTYAKGQCRIPL